MYLLFIFKGETVMVLILFMLLKKGLRFRFDLLRRRSSAFAAVGSRHEVKYEVNRGCYQDG